MPKRVRKKAAKKAPFDLKKLFKLKHHRHTGKRLKHSETSYAGLLFLLLLVGLVVKPVYPLLGSTLTRSGVVNVAVTVPGPAPSNAPNISSPADRSTVSVPLISLSGTCDPDLIVKVFNNGNFAGSTLCSAAGTFTLGISLSPGTNTLIAYIYDNLDQAGPPSATITVFYNPPSPASTPTNLPAAGAGTKLPPLILTTDFSFINLVAGQAFSWDQLMSGGTPPYTLSVNWGDGSTNTYANLPSGKFELSHTYNQAGTYHISMRLVDAAGRISVLNVVAVVNGEPVATKFRGHTNVSSLGISNLYDTIVTMLYKIALLLVLGFWAIEAAARHARRVNAQTRFGGARR